MTPPRIALVGLVILVGTVSTASAQTWEVVPFVGFRGGGGVDEIGTGREVDFEASEIFGVTVGRALGPDKRVEGTWSHQPTELDGAGLDVDIDHLHFSGVYEPRGKHKVSRYVLISAGVTRLDPGLGGADSETRLSLGVGGGARVPLSSRLSLRLEARGWAVLTDARAGAFCAGGCRFAFSADGMFQLDVSAGLAVGF